MKILDINPVTAIQFPNRIAKSTTDNKVSKLMDSAQNICFSQSDSAKQPVFNYDGSLEVSKSDDYNLVSNKTHILNWKNGFTFSLHSFIKNSGTYRTPLVQISGANRIHFYITNLTVFRFQVDGGIILNYGMGAVLDKWSEITVQYSPITNKAYLYYDGILVLINNCTITSDYDYIIQLISDQSTATDDFLVKNISVYDEPLYDINATSLNYGQTYFTPKEPALWYKRYPEDGFKKLFFNSRYLENAVINSADEITSIKDELSEATWTVPSGTAKVKPRGGFYSTLGSSLTQTPNPYLGNPTGLADFYASGWIKTDGSIEYTDVCDYNNLTLGLRYYAPLDRWYNRVKIYTSTDISNVQVYGLSLNSWIHIAALRKGGVLYSFINGKLIHSAPDSTNLLYNSNVLFKQPQGAYTDEFLYVLDSISLDPTGYAVGDKVFQPPMRGSLDSEFVQFSIPI